jgi:hypothetical protein
VLSLPTPPKCFAASVLATLHAAFARKVRARPSDCSTFEALWVHLRYGPATRSPPLKMASSIGFRMGSCLPTLLFKLRGLDFYPGGTSTHWFMPALAGRTHPGTNLPSTSDSAISHQLRAQPSRGSGQVTQSSLFVRYGTFSSIGRRTHSGSSIPTRRETLQSLQIARLWGQLC